MGFFNKYPYTNEHELNLDWIIAKINALKDRVKAVEDAIHDIVVVTPNNGKLTIKRNNTIVGDFTADQATDEDINIVVPENTSDLNNDSDFITSSDLPDMSDYYDKTETDNLLNDKADISSLSSVATTGNYNDLSNKPTIPTVNDGTLTINVNGVSAGTFTANQSTNDTINISCEPPLNWNTPSAHGWNKYTDGKGYQHYYIHYVFSSLNFNIQEGAVWLASLDHWSVNEDFTKLIYANISAQCPNKLVGAQFHSFDNVNHKFYTYYYGFTQGTAAVDLYMTLVFRP